MRASQATGSWLCSSGHVKTSVVDSQGHEIVLSFRGPGDVLGELFLGSRGGKIEQRDRDRAGGGARPGRIGVPCLSGATAERGAHPGQRPRQALPRLEPQAPSVRGPGHARPGRRPADRALRALRRPGREGRRDQASDHTGGSRQLDGLLTSRRGERAEDNEEFGWIRTERRRITVLDIDAVSQRSA